MNSMTRRPLSVGNGMSDLEYSLAIQDGKIPGKSFVHKYGRNPDVDIASGYVAVWNGGGDYTGHNCITAELLATSSSSAADSGTLASSGTATGGSKTSLVDSAATFVSDGVIVGAVIINDTKLDHAIVIAVTETTISFLTMQNMTIVEETDVYRIAIKASTGAPVVRLDALLDGNLANETSEYIILNGLTAVDTVSAYRRHSRAKIHGGDTAGVITTKQKVTVANITMVMPIGYNSTMMAAYTIPADKKGLFKTWFAGKAKKQTSFSNVRLMIRPVNDVYQVAEEVTVASTGTSVVLRDFPIPKEGLAPMTDIKIMADTDTNDNGVAAGFDIVLEAL